MARFHRAGVWHADLNAHNVMIAPDGLYLIDFDRGESARACYGSMAAMANLQRLRRSLLKLGAAWTGRGRVRCKRIWQPLIQRYGHTLTS